MYLSENYVRMKTIAAYVSSNAPVKVPGVQGLQR